MRAVLRVGDGHVVDGVEAPLRHELLEEVHEAGGARVQAEEEARQAVLVGKPVAPLLRLVVEVGALCSASAILSTSCTSTSERAVQYKSRLDCREGTGCEGEGEGRAGQR